MPGAARLSDVCTGHACWPSRPNDQASSDVFVNGRGIHRVGDHWLQHTCPSTPPETHDSILGKGSSTVFANGKAVGRIGDSIICGSLIQSGSSDVFVGG